MLLFDEEEQLKEKHADTNGDGRYDEFIYYEKGKPARAEQDTNHDGALDTKIRFGPDAKPVLLNSFLSSKSPFDELMDTSAVNQAGVIVGAGWQDGVDQEQAFIALPK